MVVICNFCESKLFSLTCPLDEVFIEFEVEDDVVAIGEDEGVWIVVITGVEQIVAFTTIEGV